MRIYNAAEHWAARRLRILPPGERELAEHVLSRGEREQLDGNLPPAPITWAVALALAGAAGVVRAVARGTRPRMPRPLAWGIAAVLLVRGVAYLPSDLSAGLEDS